MKLVVSLCLAAGWLASSARVAGGMAASAARPVGRGTAAEALALPTSITAPPSRAAARSVSSLAPQQPAPASPSNAAGSDPDDPKLAGTLTGRVLGPDAKPIAGAKIFIVPDDAKLKALGPVRVLTDADRSFSLDAPGRYSQRSRWAAGATAGPGRRPQAADDAWESRISPESPEGGDVPLQRGRESGRLGPDTLPMDSRHESVNILGTTHRRLLDGLAAAHLARHD
jgi:hypothetical protein